MDSREKIIGYYYQEVYKNYLYTGGSQERGQNWASTKLENSFKVENPQFVLEIGGGSGEHLKHVNDKSIERYVSIDLREDLPKFEDLKIPLDFYKKLEFVVGNAESLPFQETTFDRVLGTCVLHHVDDPLLVLSEVRRVTKVGGEISFALPTDPGIANQLVKRLITYKKLRKLSSIRPELFYALDHQNHVNGLIEIFKYVFRKDNVQIVYHPFHIPSWNLNLLVTLQARKTCD
jgi:phosphatidylethanolamine/phosphatidyl-N-methylethanolamine N-methyltransferase